MQIKDFRAAIKIDIAEVKAEIAEVKAEVAALESRPPNLCRAECQLFLHCFPASSPWCDPNQSFFQEANDAQLPGRWLRASDSVCSSAHYPASICCLTVTGEQKILLALVLVIPALN